MLMGHTRDVYRAGFFPDGRRVVTRSFDQTARVRDAETGRKVAALRGHKGNGTNSASFSADGQRIVTASLDGTARTWFFGPDHFDWATCARDREAREQVA